MKYIFEYYIGKTVTLVYRESEDSTPIGVKCKVLAVEDDYLYVLSSKGRRYTIKKSIVELIKGGVSDVQ